MMRNHVLTSFDKHSNALSVVIDTPKGSRSKFKYDEDSGLYELVRVLPPGGAFPFNFGFLPATLGEDEDPLDVLLLMEESFFPGCLVAGRLIGVIEASQTMAGKTVRNVKLIAVAPESARHGKIGSLDQVDERFLKQIEDFFIAYNSSFGKEFVPLSRSNSEIAAEKISQGLEAFRKRKIKEQQLGTTSTEILPGNVEELSEIRGR